MAGPALIAEGGIFAAIVPARTRRLTRYDRVLEQRQAVHRRQFSAGR